MKDPNPWPWMDEFLERYFFPSIRRDIKNHAKRERKLRKILKENKILKEDR